MEFYFEEFDIAGMIDEVTHIVQPLMKKNRNQLEITLLENVGSIYSDTTRVRQCLFNLLSNAAKFTSNGRVSLVVKRYRHKSEEWISFEVSDTGTGIPQEHLNKLFKEFTQLDSKKFQGTGLGLAISRRICHMLGGDIDVRSKVGEGTVFTIRLPIMQSQFNTKILHIG
jgi:signal transduction histidine kinase